MADTPLDVLILWHMHQPYYKSLRTGRMAMPWVRLHGVKDYLDMVLLPGEFPDIHLNINFVPSLLDQIVEYAAGETTDDVLDLSLADPESMGEDAKVHLLQTHFAANFSTMIEPHPRYADLLEMRGDPSDDRGWRRVLSRFDTGDLRDTQVWMNLTWIDPMLRRRDPFLANLIAKGAGFSEDEKLELLERHKRILGEIVPAAAAAWEAGAIEISVSPYYHPILPLLCDTDFARRARPEIALPNRRFQHPEDAEAQIREALDRAETLFGRRPTGMWPSEGAVCDEIVPFLERAGVQWIAADEEVLAHSIGIGGFVRDENGYPAEPGKLCRAYRRTWEETSVSVVFRDHALSDLIGFHLASRDPEEAAEELIARLEETQRLLAQSPKPPAVSLILDGENCWEYYKDDGEPFLRAFYGRLSASEWLRSVTVSQHLAEAGELEALPSLHSGSWINHDFQVWIGHEEENAAWDLLSDAREAYRRRLDSDPPVAPEALAQARQSLFIAEGSDWNWWYGDEHTSQDDAAFDALFREHLSNIYHFLDIEVPSRLNVPVLRPHRPAGLILPRALIAPIIEGRPTSYFEWFDAGVYDPTRAVGAMRQSRSPLLGRLYFGFDREQLYLRVDLSEHRHWDDLDGIEAAFLIFATGTWRVMVSGAGADLETRLFGETPGEGWSDRGVVDVAAAEVILELAVPFRRLDLTPGAGFSIQLELSHAGGEAERQPSQAPIPLAVPDTDFEAKMWMV